MSVRPHVVIIGAGFAGLAAARDLEGAPVEVTLLDRNNFTTFQPLLYQVATSGLNAADVAHPVRGFFHDQRNLHFRQGEATGVDWSGRIVQLADGDTLPFDHLVVAAGAVTAYFDVAGAHEQALPLYTLGDAAKVRNHVLERFEAANAEPGRVDEGELTFVVVGGGPTGVEMAGALSELFTVVFRRDYPSLPVGRARVVLVEMRDAVLGTFAPVSQQRALDDLRARRVEVRLDEAVEEITSDHVRFASGETLPARTVVWAAGVRARPLARTLGLPVTGAGRIEVDADLSVPGRPGVWAIGDIAAARTRGDDVLPQLAPVAMQSGRHVAHQIARVVAGRGTQPFRFADRGTMATIGRRSAVAELPLGIRLHGTPAWLAWLGLHLLYLAGLRNRASVLLNWAWGYLTWDSGPRIIFHGDSEGGETEATRPPEAHGEAGGTAATATAPDSSGTPGQG